MDHRDTSQPVPDDAGMGLPHFTSFLCCIGLEGGAKAIACLHMLTALVITTYMSIFAAHVSSNRDTEEDADHTYTRWFYISTGIAVGSVVHVLLAGTLLLSVIKRHRAGVACWLVVTGALTAAGVLFSLVNVCVTGFNGTGSDIFLSFLEFTCFYLFVVYCLLVVRSYYMMLRSAESVYSPPKTVI